jgi:hypothetical protein
MNWPNLAKYSGLAMAKFKTDVEFHPDAWPRFERFIRDVAKAGPQHRKPKVKTKTGHGAKKKAPPKRG